MVSTEPQDPLPPIEKSLRAVKAAHPDTDSEPLFTTKQLTSLLKQMQTGEFNVKPTPKRRTERQISATESKKELFSQARKLGIVLTKENKDSRSGRTPKTLTEIRAEITAQGEKPFY